MHVPAVTRLGDDTNGVCDIGSGCCPHSRTGVNGTVSNNVFVNSLGAHRLNDTGPTQCPHGGNFTSSSASSTVFVNGKGVTRIGDVTICQQCSEKGSHVSGSTNVFAGG